MTWKEHPYQTQFGTGHYTEMVGFPLSDDDAIDSYNLLPVLTGQEYKSPLRVATVQNTSAKAFALRQGDWVFRATV